MAEFMTGMKRTHYCGELRISDVGKTVTLFGWVAKQRDLGQLIFIDLRDRTGVTQLSFDDTTDKSVFEKAAKCRSEFVLGITGTVMERSAKSNKIATGD
ncbi:MAG: Asp-tRNA(Asn)/Glu-tRNA(Gln) amidotransferase GatCAB subunit C, partial [Clostridia bacterium]|nr:Asp-tRNA(Asn)/Glu-tRNA(Gln) amidotransferase GatCAB subunit C [Clostridia bacterium]